LRSLFSLDIEVIVSGNIGQKLSKKKKGIGFDDTLRLVSDHKYVDRGGGFRQWSWDQNIDWKEDKTNP
jgi:hypothetical protein